MRFWISLALCISSQTASDSVGAESRLGEDHLETEFNRPVQTFCSCEVSWLWKFWSCSAESAQKQIA